MLSEETLNRQLHEARGLCWHSKSLLYCLSCRGFREDKPLAEWAGPDYCSDASLWLGEGEMVKWIEEQGLVWKVVNLLSWLAPHHASLAWQNLTVSPRLRTIAVLRALGKEVT